MNYNINYCYYLYSRSILYFCSDFKNMSHRLLMLFILQFIHRFGYQGEPPFLSYDDLSPFEANYIWFRTYDADGFAEFSFPNNLVDSYFPTSIETKSINDFSLTIIIIFYWKHLFFYPQLRL